MLPLPLLADALAFIVFCVVTLGYHWFYLKVIEHHPTWSVRARMHEHRRNWVEMALKRGERIMAVQTLRNLIMTSTFLASTMILLVAFIANFVVLQEPSKTLHFAETPTVFYGGTPIPFKGALLLLLYAFAFVMFLTSLRTLSHMSILVGVDAEQIRLIEQEDPHAFLARRLNQIESLTTYGRRAVYFSIPVIGWFFSPWIFLALTVLIWIFFISSMDFARPAKETRGAAAQSTPPASSPTTK